MESDTQNMLNTGCSTNKEGSWLDLADSLDATKSYLKINFVYNIK